MVNVSIGRPQTNFCHRVSNADFTAHAVRRLHQKLRTPIYGQWFPPGQPFGSSAAPISGFAADYERLGGGVRRCRAAFLYSGQLFRAGTLDGVVLTSNSFLMQCSAESGLIVAFPCLNLAGSRTCWLRRSQSFVVHMPYALSEFEKGPSYGGPRVRILLPPAVSHVRT